MFALAPEVKDQGILDAQIWGTGLVVFTKRFQFCLVGNIEEPRPIMMANSGERMRVAIFPFVFACLFFVRDV